MVMCPACCVSQDLGMRLYLKRLERQLREDYVDSRQPDVDGPKPLGRAAGRPQKSRYACKAQTGFCLLQVEEVT